MKEEKNFFFAKFGENKHMESLLKEGVIYMNTLGFFRNCDQSKGIGDKYEGASYIHNYLKVEGEFKSKYGDVPLKVDKVQIRSVERHQGNIYSLSMINDDITFGNNGMPKIVIDERLRGLGDYNSVVFINDRYAFIKRLSCELDRCQLPFWHHETIPYNPETCQAEELTPFHKRADSKYEGQNEYRIYVKRNIDDAFSIKIGSIEDIACMKKVTDLCL